MSVQVMLSGARKAAILLLTLGEKHSSEVCKHLSDDEIEAIARELAALGAVLFCLDQSQAHPMMSVGIGTRAFVAAVLGGIGSITGAMLGGLLLGVIGELVKLTSYSGGVDVLVFLVLIGVLLVKPAGLLGSARTEKV